MEQEKLTGVEVQFWFTDSQIDELEKRFSFMPEGMSFQQRINCLLFMWLDDSTVIATKQPSTTISHLMDLTKRIKNLQQTVFELEGKLLEIEKGETTNN